MYHETQTFTKVQLKRHKLTKNMSFLSSSKFSVMTDTTKFSLSSVTVKNIGKLY